jgi:hypothetical protein
MIINNMNNSMTHDRHASNSVAVDMNNGAPARRTTCTYAVSSSSESHSAASTLSMLTPTPMRWTPTLMLMPDADLKPQTQPSPDLRRREKIRKWWRWTA